MKYEIHDIIYQYSYEENEESVPGSPFEPPTISPDPLHADKQLNVLDIVLGRQLHCLRLE